MTDFSLIIEALYKIIGISLPELEQMKAYSFRSYFHEKKIAEMLFLMYTTYSDFVLRKCNLLFKFKSED